MLEARDLTVRYGGRTAVEGVSFTLEAGDWLMLLGPNGAGKSTVLNALSQAVCYEGRVLWQGTDLKTLRPRNRAACLAVLSQAHTISYGFTVGEVVRLGRYARGADEVQVRNALETVGLTALERQPVTTLSGGELQRVFLAQVLAQDPAVLLLDEPANHLDLAYVKLVFELLEEWRGRPGKAVLSVVHDLSLARLYGGKALLLDRGRVAAAGPTEVVLEDQVLRKVYGLDVAEWMKTLYGAWEGR